MLQLLNVFTSVVNFLRGLSTEIQIGTAFVLLILLCYSFVKTLKKKESLNIGWLMITLIVIALNCLYFYAIF